jgi:hypothetical protein
MDIRQVLESERGRLRVIVEDVNARLAKLTAQIKREGQTVEGSQGQRVLNPLLRAETSVRTELRRVSSDLAACEGKISQLPPGPGERDWRLMRSSEWETLLREDEPAARALFAEIRPRLMMSLEADNLRQAASLKYVSMLPPDVQRDILTRVPNHKGEPSLLLREVRSSIPDRLWLGANPRSAKTPDHPDTLAIVLDSGAVVERAYRPSQSQARPPLGRWMRGKQEALAAAADPASEHEAEAVQSLGLGKAKAK